MFIGIISYFVPSVCCPLAPAVPVLSHSLIRFSLLSEGPASALGLRLSALLDIAAHP